MEEKEKKLLSFIKDNNYVPMKAKQIASILGIAEEEKKDLLALLKKLEQDGKVQKDDKNRYSFYEETLLEGIFRGNKKGYGFVIFPTMEQEDVYIPEDKTKQALNEDIVLVKINKQKASGFRAEGEIIKIKKHGKDTLVGIFQKNRNFGFVIPDDTQFGTDIFISKKKFHHAKNDQKVVVKITKYPQKGKKAEGEIIEVLGNQDQADIDFLSLIKEYRLPYEFPEDVIKQTNNIREEIEKKDIPYRKDLREELLFTIDGEEAKDLDDAVCVKRLENGNYFLNVSIADVSHYVKQGSLIDQEACLRGTSIYFLNKVIPMLPNKLSNGICSLNAGQDRFTLSVLMEIDKKGKVVSSEIVKAIVNVKERMTYTNVQKILDKSDKKVLKRYEPYLQEFENMKQLAVILKKRREKEGYLELDIPETKIEYDKKGNIMSIQKRQNTFANELIEQFMLTANEVVAERFFWLQAPFIYRVHEQPDLDRVKELNKFLYNLGYIVRVSQEKVYTKAFSSLLKQVKGTKEEKIVSNLILHTLKLARYEEENKGHFGLASKYYCHFTSPIRRYPDLFVHRMISKWIEQDYRLKEKQKEIDRQLARKYAQSSSEREKLAQKVERDSVEMKKAEYMSDKIGKIYTGIISNVTSFGIFVELDNTVEGLIRFENLGKEYFVYDDEHKQIIGEKTGKTYHIGDEITVKVIEASKQLRRITFSKQE